MRRSDAKASIISTRKYGVFVSSVVGLLVAWNTPFSLGLAAALALGCVIGGFEIVAMCALASLEKHES